MVTRAVQEAVSSAGAEAGSVLVACSGGVDSTVLVAALQELGRNLSIGHVNHGLRGAESDADEAWVRRFAKVRGLGVWVERVDPRAAREGHGSRSRPTLQEAARALRYAALERLADGAGAAWIATGHHADDQAETLLLRLLRGVGPDGLTGIPVRRGRVIRPLLRVPRGAIEDFARERGLAWREDPSNQSPVYTRNRVRQLIAQLEEEFNPNLSRSLGDLAEALQGDRDWLEALTQREVASRVSNLGGVQVIEGKDIQALPDALARRLVREALHRAGAGREVTRTHIERMTGFLRTGRDHTAIELPGGLELAREGESFQLRARLTKTKR